MKLVEFGDALLRTQDLDPVYVAIHKSNIFGSQLAQLLTAYWCFYSLGAAAYISEAKTPKAFWERMMQAALNEESPRIKLGERWPRAAERRHFRGAQATSAVLELTQRYPKGAASFVDYLYKPYDGAQPTFDGVSARVREHRGFGEWIAFKIADMGERVLGHPVDFSNCELGIYKDPRQGAALAWVISLPLLARPESPWLYPITDGELKKIVAELVALWRGKRAKAPPDKNRLVNVQEIETILCKYKSYYKGHYHVGKDIDEVGHGLEGWGDTAQELKAALPPRVINKEA